VDRSGKIVLFSKRFAKMWKIPDDVLDSKDDKQALAFVLEQWVIRVFNGYIQDVVVLVNCTYGR